MKDRLPQLGVLLVGTAFFGYWALLVYCDVWRPSPLGLRLSADAGHVLVDEVITGGPAQRAGLRAGDRVASFDGHPLAGRLDWMTVEANLEIGRTTQLSAAVGAGRRRGVSGRRGNRVRGRNETGARSFHDALQWLMCS